MKNLIIIITVLIFAGCNQREQNIRLESPDHQIILTAGLTPDQNKLFYSVNYKGKIIIDTSFLGLLASEFDLSENNELINWKLSSTNEEWSPVWGQKRKITNEYNQISIFLKHKQSKIKFSLDFRCFNDGIAFRYIIQDSPGYDSIHIIDELTTFNIPGSPVLWSIPAFKPLKYELLYRKTGLDLIDTVHTPLTMEIEDSIFISIHEANLNNYASMTMFYRGDQLLETELFPWQDGIKVKSKLPLETPWRMVQIEDTPGDLIESDMILNLNPPTDYKDVSWITPRKYMGIWWGIHINKYSFQQGPKHGATTENTVRYIDFAAQNGFDELLVEGWNKGWEGAWYSSFGINMDFVSPTPDFNLDSVQNYALTKGISLQGYIETCANTNRFLDQIDSAFSLFQTLGYRTVKIGHVGPKFFNGEYHHGQYGVNYYRNVIKKAAEYQLMVNFHEPIKPTGESRTYPNMMTSEGARGQEYNASWSTETNPPAHTCILPFTRLLGGPMDFTPGIFDLRGYDENNRVNTTIAKQLALYAIIYSPIQMAADLPENYKDHPCFQFIKDIPVEWETFKVMNAKIGEFVTIVRKDKHSNDWYLGSITNEHKREFDIELSFLDQDKKYLAIIYKDTAEAGWKSAPTAYEILTKEVSASDRIKIVLASGGGQAIQFKCL